MTPALETLTIEFPRENNDIFAWSPSDFQGIGLKIIMHRINMDPQVKPIKQKNRTFGVEMNKIIEEEVNKCYLPKACEQDVQRPNRKVYVDDMLMKSKREEEHLKHLENAFASMQTYIMKLNPMKCTFGVRGGNFLGYMVSEKGIEANPEKIEAIMYLGSPRMVKDVQKLTGNIASLNCFTVRSEYKNIPFFKILRKALTEIHEGSYRNHSVGRTLAQKVLKQECFCLTMVEDAKEFSKKCESCQKFATTSHIPTTPMESIKITCPFDQWGIDIVGPFPLTVAQKKFMVAAVEYFSKWVEAEALARISEKEKFTTFGNRQANGQTEVMNRILLQHLKIRLEGANSAWVEELPGVFLGVQNDSTNKNMRNPIFLGIWK
ncbi:UNVERIFIED_CONTAM: Transposon Tf2-12 polyprotein [Sesamum calycinum]|uniref:Transposon Tf2-12 polyprotein n=1 Tax=Sesamum calycinum TaxID=2727403 RepID=A0AAW2M9B9_9LAMI